MLVLKCFHWFSSVYQVVNVFHSLSRCLDRHGVLNLSSHELGETQLAELNPFQLVPLTTEVGHCRSLVLNTPVLPECHDRTSNLCTDVVAGLFLSLSEVFYRCFWVDADS